MKQSWKLLVSLAFVVSLPSSAQTWEPNSTSNTLVTTGRVVIGASLTNASGNTIPFIVKQDGLPFVGTAKYSFRVGNSQDTHGFVIGYDDVASTGLLAAVAGDALAFWTYNGTAFGERMRIAQSGAILVNSPVPTGSGTSSAGTKLDVEGSIKATGDISANGNIAAKYQDVAEWVSTTEHLRPGTVVVLDPERSNQVIASGRAYDTTVAGVVSDKPGIILGEESATKEKVATTGRVLVRVDASRGPIKIGDLLVTSGEPGFAMRSQPVPLGGVEMHRPGTILGKALQPLSAGRGEILVLLSLQ